MEYYGRLDVRRAILDFARAGDGRAVRECAFYNARARSVQRHFSGGEPVFLDSAADIDRALASGATAFYCSYWRYSNGGLSRSFGHDLVWTVRARRGGLGFVKLVTKWALDALADAGVSEPWVKYSGQLGFDLVIPLEAIQCEASGVEDGLSSLQRGLTGYIASYLIKQFPRVSIDGAFPSLLINQGTETCLLSELRVRRGLLLAPMSLNPESGLVSMPLEPSRVMNFSALDASRVDVQAYEWKIPRVSTLSMFVPEPYHLAAPARIELAPLAV